MKAFTLAALVVVLAFAQGRWYQLGRQQQAAQYLAGCPAIPVLAVMLHGVLLSDQILLESRSTNLK